MLSDTQKDFYMWHMITVPWIWWFRSWNNIHNKILVLSSTRGINFKLQIDNSQDLILIYIQSFETGVAKAKGRQGHLSLSEMVGF